MGVWGGACGYKVMGHVNICGRGGEGECGYTGGGV